MWELDCEESWVPKYWYFWTVVLEKTLESPLNCKEIQPVHSTGDQSWVFIGRTDVEAETAILWPPDAKNWFIWKDADAGKDWRREEKGTTEDEMVGWHHGLNGHEFEEAPGVGDGQGSLACCSPWGRKDSNTTEKPNWTELMHIFGAYLVAHMVKNLPALQETWVRSLVRKIPWKREWQPTPVFLLGEVHGQRSLVGYSPWSCKELDTTDQLTVSLLTGGSASKESAWSAGDLGSIPGKEYSSSVEYFCLENLMDWGAWWATVHRVTKRRTWLTALSICVCIYLTH